MGGGIAGTGLAGQGNGTGTSSCGASVSGACAGSDWIAGSEARDGGDGDEGFGISFNCLKNFLFLSVTLPVPSTFTAYWS